MCVFDTKYEQIKMIEKRTWWIVSVHPRSTKFRCIYNNIGFRCNVKVDVVVSDRTITNKHHRDIRNTQTNAFNQNHNTPPHDPIENVYKYSRQYLP
jgi:hypothetical protein